MGYFVWLLGPWVIGFVVGAVFSWDFRAAVKKNREAALKALAHRLRDRDVETSDVIRLFEEHGHKFIDERQGRLYFKPDPASKWTKWETFVAAEGVFWTLILFGAPILCLAAFYFFARPNEQIELDLQGLLASL